MAIKMGFLNRSFHTKKSLILVTFVCMVKMLTVSDALMCYECANTAGHGDCVDNIEGLINGTKGIHKYRYTNNCSDSKASWDRCVLEVHSAEKDAITLFYRGCHDGKSFNPAFYHKRFANLAPNNKTTCAKKDQLICFTFCDTDFCNGPQPPNDTNPCPGDDPMACDGSSLLYQHHPWVAIGFSLLCGLVLTYPFAERLDWMD